jgi:hypothetical protein
MRQELDAVVKEFPKATVIGVADGARDNWQFLDEVTDRQVIDFFHVAEHLNESAEIVCRDDIEKEAWLAKRCHDLKHKPKAAAAIGMTDESVCTISPGRFFTYRFSRSARFASFFPIFCSIRCSFLRPNSSVR